MLGNVKGNKSVINKTTSSKSHTIYMCSATTKRFYDPGSSCTIGK